MKRIITASSNFSAQADRYLQYVGSYAEGLSKIVNATSDEEASRICQEYIFRVPLKTKAECIESAFQNLQYAMDQYKKASTVVANYPRVEKEVIDAAEASVGHVSYKQTVGSSVSYVIEDAASFSDYQAFCKDMQRRLGIKDRDGAAIEGSWTGHNYVLDSVPFKIEWGSGSADGRGRAIVIYFK